MGQDGGKRTAAVVLAEAEMRMNRQIMSLQLIRNEKMFDFAVVLLRD